MAIFQFVFVHQEGVVASSGFVNSSNSRLGFSTVIVRVRSLFLLLLRPFRVQVIIAIRSLVELIKLLH